MEFIIKVLQKKNGIYYKSLIIKREFFLFGDQNGRIQKYIYQYKS